MSVDADTHTHPGPFTRAGGGVGVFEDGERPDDELDWEAAAEKITVKIADLGNGTFSSVSFPYSH